MADKTQKKKTIVFFHPDLGIGGAERLVVDAAVGLQNRGHKVVIFTSHCDPKHCFDEARDGTLDVRVRGDWLVPPSIFSRLAILCAILRQLLLIAQICATSELGRLRPDAFFVDQLSAGLPALRLARPGVPVLFYCHFPDLLLARGRARWWKRAYRRPFDALERWSMGFADAVAVNSGFTRGVVSRTWPGLAASRELRVVYPCVDVRTPAEKRAARDGKGKQGGGGGGGGGEKDAQQLLPDKLWKDSKKIVLSINRFERKKDIALAIRAYAGVPRERREGVRLVVAGGYDHRVAENVEYHRELVGLAEGELGLRCATTRTVVAALSAPDDVEVLFLLSVPDELKDLLLRSARLLVYTPSNEHFGIVPLEAMLAGVPVLAANTGGPTETVVEGVTGWLRPPGEAAQWAAAVDRALHGLSAAERAAMARAGAERVRERFSGAGLARTLDGILAEIEAPAAARSSSSSSSSRAGVLAAGGVLAALGALLVALVALVVARASAGGARPAA